MLSFPLSWAIMKDGVFFVLLACCYAQLSRAGKFMEPPWITSFTFMLPTPRGTRASGQPYQLALLLFRWRFPAFSDLNKPSKSPSLSSQLITCFLFHWGGSIRESYPKLPPQTHRHLSPHTFFPVAMADGSASNPKPVPSQPFSPLRGYCFNNFFTAGGRPSVFKHTVIVLSFNTSLSESHCPPLPFLCFSLYHNFLKEFSIPSISN